LGTQDTGQRQTKRKVQYIKLKRWATRTPPKTGGEPNRLQRTSSPYLPQDTLHDTHIVNIRWTPHCANKHK